MSRLEMKEVELGELYGLLDMYGRTYGGVPGELLDSIEGAYKRQGGNGTVRNPRGAGRKKRTTAEEKEKAKGLREKGYKIREISKEMGCSIGLVHKLIYEQRDI